MDANPNSDYTAVMIATLVLLVPIGAGYAIALLLHTRFPLERLLPSYLKTNETSTENAAHEHNTLPFTSYGKYTLLFLFLAFAALFPEAAVPLQLAINGWLASLALFAFGWQLQRSPLKPLTWPLLAYWGLTAITTIISGSSDGIRRIGWLIVLTAIYHLPIDTTRFRMGARLAGWILFPLIIIAPWDNSNTLSFTVWSLFLLGIGTPLINNIWATRLFSALAIIALIFTQSEGAMLAVAFGGLVWLWYQYGRQNVKWTIGLAAIASLMLLIVVVSKIDSVGSFGVRVEIYQAILDGYSLLGRGAGTFEITVTSGLDFNQAHNLFLTILWETGLLGLIIFAWLLYRSWQLTPEVWAAIWLAAFLSHSMIDEPLFSNLVSAVSTMVVLSSLKDSHIDNTIHPDYH